MFPAGGAGFPVVTAPVTNFIANPDTLMLKSVSHRPRLIGKLERLLAAGLGGLIQHDCNRKPACPLPDRDLRPMIE